MAEKRIKTHRRRGKRQADVGRGIARLDERAMKKLDVKQGDILEMVGTKTTGAIAVKRVRRRSRVGCRSDRWYDASQRWDVDR